MNIRTLSEEIVDYETGALPVALYPERMIKSESGKQKYFARVLNRGKLNIEDIADDLVVFGSKRTKEEIVRDWHETCAAIIDRLINGCTVDADYFTFSLQVKGLFDSKQDIFKKGRNCIELQVRPTKKLQQILDTLDCKIAIGRSIIPSIKTVYDGSSKTENQILTRGGYLKINGENIRIFGEQESVGIYFVQESDESNTVKVSERHIISSSPSELLCIVPVELKENERYRIKIVTQYMRTSKARKVPLSCISKDVFVAK